MAYMVRGPDGKEHGPVEIGTLISWAQTGSLPANAPVRDLSTGADITAGQISELTAIYPQQDFSKAPAPAVGTKSGGSAMLPTNNPDALWGYYLGWASLICVVGLLVAPISLYKSIRGYKAYKQNPEIYGAFHSITGIVLASVGSLISIGLIVLFLVNLE